MTYRENNDTSEPHGTDDSPAGAPSQRRPRKSPPREIGGADGPEPTRYGDWERNGRCTDF